MGTEILFRIRRSHVWSPARIPLRIQMLDLVRSEGTQLDVGCAFSDGDAFPVRRTRLMGRARGFLAICAAQRWPPPCSAVASSRFW